MSAAHPRPERETQQNEPERTSRFYVLLILAIVIASLAIFILLSHPTRPSSIPHPSAIPLSNPAYSHGIRSV
jgi:hypothetical protein